MHIPLAPTESKLSSEAFNREVGAGWKREVNKNGNKRVYLWTQHFKTASQNTNCVSKVPMCRGSQKSKHEIKIWSDVHFLNHNFFLMLIVALSPNLQAVTTPTSFIHKKVLLCHNPMKAHISNMSNASNFIWTCRTTDTYSWTQAHACDSDKADTQQPSPAHDGCFHRNS